MKKIISCLIMVFMVVSMINLGYAASSVPVVNQTINTRIDVKTTTDTNWSEDLNASLSSLPKVVAKATLDMSSVRNKVNALSLSQSQIMQDLENGYVKSTITVEIAVPNHANFQIDETEKLLPAFSYAKVADPSNSTDISTFFIEDKSTRTFISNKLTMTLNTPKTLLSDLNTNRNQLLDDIVLDASTLGFDVPEFGTIYTLSGSLTCTAKIYETSADADADTNVWRTYNFTASDSATVRIDQYNGGGSSTGGLPSVVVPSSKPATSVPNSSIVTIEHKDIDSTDRIYYTTDGSEPSVDENGHLEGTTKLYTGSIIIDEDAELKVITVKPNGETHQEHDVTVNKLEVIPSIADGTVKYGDKVELKNNDKKDIYYTTDGSAPSFDEKGNPTGTTQKYIDAIELTEDTEIKMVTVDKSGKVSEVSTHTYDVAPRLSEEDIIYIKGDDLGNFNPENPITRAEVAAIFSRLTLETMNVQVDFEAGFSDISGDDWYHDYVALMEKVGIIKGYEDGTFRPNNSITRAEFATMAARFDRLSDINKKAFDDVSTFHWAFESINSAADKGWVTGYEDGTFRPDNQIKRCEAVTIVNRILDEDAEAKYKDKDLSGLTIFPDADGIDMHWAFYEIIDSANLEVFSDINE